MPDRKSDRLHVFIATLPKGDDPDSFIRREGPVAFQTLVDAAVPAGSWLLDRAATEPNAAHAAELWRQGQRITQGDRGAVET